MKKFSRKGFTVLELLIVIAIMCILITLILVGLNSARAHSRDQNKVTAIQNIVIGLSQFHDICRSYPATLDANDPTATCAALSGKTIADFIPNLDSYHFNAPGSDYAYAGLTTDQVNANDCTNFHIGVSLESDASASSDTRSGFDIAAYNALPQNIGRTISVCAGSSDPVDGTSSSVYDIEK